MTSSSTTVAAEPAGLALASRRGAHERRKAFAAEYLKDFDAARAYRVAFAYEPQGAADYAASRGGQLLAEPEMQAYLREMTAQRLERVQVEGDEILRELLRIASADLIQMVDPQDGLAPIDQIPLALRRAIASFEVEEHYEPGAVWDADPVTGEVRKNRNPRPTLVRVKKIKLESKLRALELLAKHKGLLNESLTLKLPGEGSEALDEEALAARIAALLEAARQRKALATQSEDIL